MAPVFDPALLGVIRKARFVATLNLSRVEDAVPLARALLAGGVSVLEITLRTECGLEGIRRVREAVPEMQVGAGTVLTPAQVNHVQESGALFAMAPGFNPRVVQAAIEAGLSFTPGVCSPSEVEQALEQGCRFLKVYPFGEMGGLPYLQSLAGPYHHLGVEYLPLGGIHPGNAGEILREPWIAAVGGSWLARPELIQAGNWAEIESIARLAVSDL